MAGRDGGAPIEPGIISRVALGIRFAFSGKSANEFFGPGTPVAPAAQEQAKGRAYDYPIGYNIQQQPRAGEAVNFVQLRALADSHDLLRLAIETRKDQMAKLLGVVKPKDGTPPDDRCKKIQAFLERPDVEHDWDDWLRMWLEEVFVTDAPSIYPRKTKGGQLYALEHIDGATIKRILSADGRTPLPPDPAYSQVIKGISAVTYTREELYYLPRNVRVSRIYGYSPVEQIIMTVNIALRRQVHQLNYYTEGNIPAMLVNVPQTWNTDQIEKFQKYWDLIMSGDLAKLQKVKFVPGDMKSQLLQTEKLFDETDEWLARVICYAMNLPPNAFVKQQNRATAGTAQEVALEEGLAPIMRYVSTKLSWIIAQVFGAPDLEFTWEDMADVDPLVQAQIDDLNVKNGTKTVDEIREDRGDDPLTDEQKAEIAAAKPAPPGGSQSGGDPKDTKGNPDGVTAAAAEKTAAEQLAAIGEVRTEMQALRKQVETPAPVEKPDTRIHDFAELVEHGVPANKAAKHVQLAIDEIPGGDVPMVRATLIPLAIANDVTTPLEPVEKSAPAEPAPIIIPAPNVYVTVEGSELHTHIPPNPPPGDRVVKFTKDKKDRVVSAVIEEKKTDG